MGQGNCRVGIIGAGIIGVSTACFLAERGYPVTIIDPEAPGDGGASRHNAAQIFPALIHPLPSPRIMREVPRLLFDPMSPLTIPPAYIPKIAPWLVRFALASTQARHDAGVAALTDLNAGAVDRFRAHVGQGRETTGRWPGPAPSRSTKARQPWRAAGTCGGRCRYHTPAVPSCSMNGPCGGWNLCSDLRFTAGSCCRKPASLPIRVQPSKRWQPMPGRLGPRSSAMPCARSCR